MNTSASKVFFLPQLVLKFFRDLDQFRPRITTTAESLGCDLSFANEKNKAFFALEFLEQRFLRQFLFELSKLCHLTSLLLIHDGVYFSPPVAAETVQLAASIASEFLSIPPLEMKHKCLQQEWYRTFGHLERIQTLAPCPKKKCKRAFSELAHSAPHLPAHSGSSLWGGSKTTLPP